MLRIRTLSVIFACVFGLALTMPRAEDPPAGAANEEESTVLDEISDYLAGGDFKLNLRLRGELADITPGGRYSEAYTSRLRIGYGLPQWMGFTAYAELEDIRAASDDTYNAAGLNRQGNHTVIADPVDTELNQLFIAYTPTEDLDDVVGELVRKAMPTVQVGRQRVKLDDDRFIGNVGWRQNEQTFDAAVAQTSLGIDKLRAIYGYVWDVNRIFGPDSGLDLRTNVHLFNINYAMCESFDVTGFAYLLDLQNAAAASTNTVGIRITGGVPVSEDQFALKYEGSFAWQEDAFENAAKYDAIYGKLQVTGVIQKDYDVGAGYEILGAGRGASSFQTPLATLHKHNGFADMFLATPPNGLQDVYIVGGANLPLGLKARGWFHMFFEDQGGSRYGQEIDAALSKKLTKNLSALVKYAWFDGDNGMADIYKVWFQIELNID